MFLNIKCVFLFSLQRSSETFLIQRRIQELACMIINVQTSSCIAQNSIEVDAKTKESTRKTEEKLDGRNKEGHARKKPK
jgi:hypothetical protein